MLDAHLIAKTRPQADPANIVLWGDMRVTVLTDRLFRLERDEGRIFCDEATEAVWFRDMPPVPFTREERDGKLVISTARATLVVGTSREESCVILDGREIPLDNGGNLGGTYSTLDRCDGGDWIGDNETHPIALDLGVVSTSGVAVLDYTRSSVLTAEGMIRKMRRDDLDLYIFAYGHDYREAVRAFYMICGDTPRIPRFALGNWWSRYYAYTEREYLALLDRMEQREIPITVATVDMDWHWNTENLDRAKGITASGRADAYHGGTSGWTGYSWNTELFPDYRAFLKKVKERGYAVTLNLHPATGVRWFEDMYEEMATAMGIDPKSEATVKLDFSDPRFINAYFKILHKPYEHDGVDFWWIDWQQGPRAKAAGIDIMWVLNHYHTMDNGKEHMPLILSRYSGLGAHRYPLGFSGDTHTTWKTLDYLPYFTANASNIGFTWWSHDIGGHMGGAKDDELYVRFVQFGVFSPINRLHCTVHDFCTKEPRVYGNGTGLIAEEFLRLRHRMIPYLYSAMLDTNEHGRALIEPMYYEYPEEENAYRYRNQYLFGGQLLVRPVTVQGDEKKLARTDVWLPKGRWTDIFTGDVYEGGRVVSMVRSMESLPVLAREGGFFVLDDRRHTNDISLPDRLTVMSFLGDGEYTLREDGAETRFVSRVADGVQTVTVCPSEGAVTRKLRLELRNIARGEVRVYADGKEIDAEVYEDGYLTVILDEVRGGACYTVETAFTASAREYRDARYLYALTRMELSVSCKTVLWSARELSDRELYETIMARTDVTENEKLRLTEAWYTG